MTRVTVDRHGLAIDGRPFFLLAGQIHYFRWPRAEWRSILLKARAGGLNTVDTVVPWNLHEPSQGAYQFENEADLAAYLDLIQELGMRAIVRPGPYICAEWENGGFPAWLTAHLRPGENGLALRTTDPRFFLPTLRWFDVLIPLLAERQLDRGGPIILVQIENEHWASGVYGHDNYQQALAQAMNERGVSVPLYTCMGPGVATRQVRPNDAQRGEGGGLSAPWPEFRNGWTGIAEKLVDTRRLWPNNPMIVSELWSGWFDDWGSSRHNGKTAAALDWRLHELLAVGASGISHWMWAGGTNFGFWGGRTVGGDTVHMTTSYDYDAPVSEYGGLTEKFFVARRHHLLLDTLGSQLSGLIGEEGGRLGPASHQGRSLPVIQPPKAVPGRAAGGLQPLTSLAKGSTTATFLQNPTLERQTYGFLTPGEAVGYLPIEVEVNSIKPIFTGLPLAGSNLTLDYHTSRLLGFWRLSTADVLVLHGFEGEAGQLQFSIHTAEPNRMSSSAMSSSAMSSSAMSSSEEPKAITLLDPDDAVVSTEGGSQGSILSVSYWIKQRPVVVRARTYDVAAGEPRLVVVVLLTTAQAERWWPLGEAGFLCGPRLVTGVTNHAEQLDVEVVLGSSPDYPCFRITARGERAAVSLPETPPLGTLRAAGTMSLEGWERLAIEEQQTDQGWQPIAGPQPLEELGCPLGYGWYRLDLDLAEPTETTLAAPWLADRATVFLDGQPAGTLGIGDAGPVMALPVKLAGGLHDLRLLVDNLGRFNYGSNTGERKGLLDQLYWEGVQEDISGGWIALWQEAVFAGEAIANSKPAHVRPDATDVHLNRFAYSGPSVWLLREVVVPAGRRAILNLVGDRNPGALYVNGHPVARFSRHYGGGYLKYDITPLLRDGTNVLALYIQNYAGHPWQAVLLHYDPDRRVESSSGAGWRFKAGVTPSAHQTPATDGPAFWRSVFPYDRQQHGDGPFKLGLYGMGKGQLWLNGRNLGRYWQIGPQEFYKVPVSWLVSENQLMLLEEQGRPPQAVILAGDVLGCERTVVVSLPLSQSDPRSS